MLTLETNINHKLFLLLVIPTVLMAFISMAVFFLPADSTEKITVSLFVYRLTKVQINPLFSVDNFRLTFNCRFLIVGIKNITSNFVYNSIDG